jgi:hypothetical protein
MMSASAARMWTTSLPSCAVCSPPFHEGTIDIA